LKEGATSPGAGNGSGLFRVKGVSAMKIPRTELAQLLRQRPDLTLIETWLGPTHQYRRVAKITPRELSFYKVNPKNPESITHVTWHKGDWVDLQPDGFSIVSKNGERVTYKWGHI
jgi:hypothetical protein